MKPDFALSLSFDGIRLLLRAAGGWQRVGEADVSDADLPAALAKLRDMALRLNPDGFQTKLIIPDEQIRYLSIETGALSDAQRIEAARDALEGATPYPVDALAFDISAEGSTTHIAAVARETLSEAEAFAREHRFNPVSFVAAPESAGFLGEPHFGLTAQSKSLMAEGETVEPDGVRVVVIGDYDPSEKPDEPIIVDAKAPVPENNDKPDTEPDPADGAIEPSSDTPETDSPQPLPNLVNAETISEASAAPSTELARSFSSRRSTGKVGATSLGGVTRKIPPAPPAKPVPVPLPPTPVNPPQASVDSLRPIDPPAIPPEMGLAPEPEAARSDAFLSRRKPRDEKRTKAAGRTKTAPASDKPKAKQKAAAFSGADAVEVGGKPRYLGLILTAVLLIFLAGVAAWATVFLDESISKLFKGRERTLASTLPEDTQTEIINDIGATTTAVEDAVADEVELVSLTTADDNSLTSEDAAVLDALRDPLPDPQETAPERPSAATLEARYAVTGIWPQAPDFATPSETIPLEDLFITGIDPISPALDAVALPAPTSFQTDAQPALVTSPVASGTRFTLGADGFVKPTAEGAITPDGHLVFLGPPPIVPPATPVRFATDPTETETLQTTTQVRPRTRPIDLVEQNERATLGGLSRSELSGFRPQLRPQAAQQKEEQERGPVADDAPPSALAVAQSYRPKTRPVNFPQLVARAKASTTTPSAASTATTRTASVAPRTVTPAIPSSASVSRQATVRNAINLKKVNLIGVFGTPSDRRALVRLSNGRYRKVQVGDRIDGGRVSAIGDNELRYRKGARNLVLKMPKD